MRRRKNACLNASFKTDRTEKRTHRAFAVCPGNMDDRWHLLFGMVEGSQEPPHAVEREIDRHEVLRLVVTAGLREPALAVLFGALQKLKKLNRSASSITALASAWAGVAPLPIFVTGFLPIIVSPPRASN